MICAIAFHSGDFGQAVDLLDWINLLDGCKAHDCLLIADSEVQWNDCLRLMTLAREGFQNVEMITAEPPRKGWPMAANAMFMAAAHHLAGKPFFWCEPDCIPLRAGWLDELQHEYERIGKPFMGALVRSTQVGLPEISLGGCAVYPRDAAERLRAFCTGERAWDVASSEAVVPLASDTKLVQWFWGQPQLAPTFAVSKFLNSPVNTFTQKHISQEAVVFHRNKDGTLIRILKQNMFPGSVGSTNPFVVVLPFCNRDSNLMIKNVNWMIELGGCKDFDCVLASDWDTLGNSYNAVESLSKKCFRSVKNTRYSCGSTASWPQGANIAFRHVCFYMSDKDTAFLWLEADAIPVKPNWLNILQWEYDNCGKLFMGPIVPGMGHMNGVGVYPVDTIHLIPNALSTFHPIHIAWDSAMKAEMIHQCHDAGNLIQHVWGIGSDGKPSPVTGESPVFDATWKLTNWVNHSTVLFHRNKDGSLIDCIKTFHKHHTT